MGVNEKMSLTGQEKASCQPSQVSEREEADSWYQKRKGVDPLQFDGNWEGVKVESWERGVRGVGWLLTVVLDLYLRGQLPSLWCVAYWNQWVRPECVTYKSFQIKHIQSLTAFWALLKSWSKSMKRSLPTEFTAWEERIDWPGIAYPTEHTCGRFVPKACLPRVLIAKGQLVLLLCDNKNMPNLDRPH
jgi:hypothetical protein